jgi:hypothetical protein
VRQYRALLYKIQQHGLSAKADARWLLSPGEQRRTSAVQNTSPVLADGAAKMLECSPKRISFVESSRH